MCFVVAAVGSCDANHTEGARIDVVARWTHVQRHGQVKGWGCISRGGGGHCPSQEIATGSLGLCETVGGFDVQGKDRVVVLHRMADGHLSCAPTDVVKHGVAVIAPKLLERVVTCFDHIGSFGF